jgi:hypothetical protein
MTDCRFGALTGMNKRKSLLAVSVVLEDAHGGRLNTSTKVSSGGTADA